MKDVPEHFLGTMLVSALVFFFFGSATATALQYDAVIVGSGIGGLSCGATLAAAGKSVCVLEAHDHLGGAAHDWAFRGYRFENGPSLYAGLSPERSPNPLKHVFQICGETPDFIRYDRWGFCEGASDKFAAAVGARDFLERILPAKGADTAQWRRLLAALEPVGSAVFALPPAALREDVAAVLTLGRYGKALLDVLSQGDLSRPFSAFLEEQRITDPFIRNWLDMLSFLLQGATTEEAPTSLMAYMLSDFYRPGVCLDYPVGGTRGIVDALVRGVLKGHPDSTVLTQTEVVGLHVSENKVLGVRTAAGDVLRGKHVISNADLWSTLRLARDAAPLVEYLEKQRDRLRGPCDSFLHLHLGIDATGLPTAPSEPFPAQWAFLESFDRGVDAPRNLALVSVASLLDPSLAPPGRHVVHAYVPATEPWDRWAPFLTTAPRARRDYEASAAYRAAKDEATQILWRAVEQYIPDVKKRVDVQFAATPLTHARFLRRHRGTYGPFLPASTGQLLMGHRTPLRNFWMCGDSTFPGIGVPAVAASGLITANSILSPLEHWRLLDRIRL